MKLCCVMFVCLYTDYNVVLLIPHHPRKTFLTLIIIFNLSINKNSCNLSVFYCLIEIMLCYVCLFIQIITLFYQHHTTYVQRFLTLDIIHDLSLNNELCNSSVFYVYIMLCYKLFVHTDHNVFWFF